MLPVELFVTLIVGVLFATVLNLKSNKPKKTPTLEQRVKKLEKRMKKADS